MQLFVGLMDASGGLLGYLFYFLLERDPECFVIHNGNAFFTIKNALHHRSNILRESSQIEVEKVILLGSILKFNLLPPPHTVLIF